MNNTDWTSPDGMARVLLGDVRQRLADLPDCSVHAVVTSPPYWGLRDYGVAGQIGKEATPEEYLANMVAVFREVRRVLRYDGVCFVNMGDSYGGYHGNSRVPDDEAPSNKPGYIENMRRSLPEANGNQLLMPHRLALAMQGDGWTLRSTIIFGKRSPMPESLSGWRWVRCRVKIGPSEQRPIPTATGRVNYNVPGAHASKGTPDTSAKWQPCTGCAKCSPNGGYVLRRGAWRPTTGHEYVFMFTKGMRYFCDGEACKERCSPNTNGKGRILRDKAGVEGVERNNAGWSKATAGEVSNRNPRSVWSLSSEPFKGAHFATFPGMLVYRCLLAATSKAGCCPECGAAWAPVVERGEVEMTARREHLSRSQRAGHPMAVDSLRPSSLGCGSGGDQPRIIAVTGYRPTCGCDAGPGVPMTVLDPFSGSGTTGQVCRYMGLRYVGIELNPEYLEMSKVRIVTPWRPRGESKPGTKPRKANSNRKTGTSRPMRQLTLPEIPYP